MTIGPQAQSFRLPDVNTRFALPIICPATGEEVSAETLYNRCCDAMGHVVDHHIGDLILDNLRYPDDHSGDAELNDAVYAWAGSVHVQLLAATKAVKPNVTRCLRVNKSGTICLETSSPGLLTSGIARDLIFNIQWFSTKGWIDHGEFTDPPTARQCFREQRERNRSIRWRLIARNEHGQVTLPNTWRGGYGS